MTFKEKRLLNNYKYGLKLVKEDGMNLRLLSKKLRNNKDIVYYAVKRNGEALQYASDKLRNDKRFCMQLFRDPYLKYGGRYKYVSDTLKNDREFTLLASDEDIDVFENMPVEFRNDIDIVCNCIRLEKKNILPLLSDELRDNTKIGIQVVKYKPSYFESLSERLKKDSSWIVEYYKNGGIYGEVSTPDFKGIPEIAKKSEELMVYISSRLAYYCADNTVKIYDDWHKDNPNIMLAVAQRKIKLLRFASDRLKDDDDFMTKACLINPGAIAFASDRLKMKHELHNIVLQHVNCDSIDIDRLICILMMGNQMNNETNSEINQLRSQSVRKRAKSEE